MLVGGWGFQTNWELVAKAALIWRGVRPLHLVRQRHKNDLRAGIAVVNMASLPQEIMKMIEDVLVSDLKTEVSSQKPFKFELQNCCCDDCTDVHSWSPYEDALSQLEVQYNIDLDTDGGYDTASNEFSKTSLAEELEERSLKDKHYQEDRRDQRDMQSYFWQFLAKSEDAPYELYRLLDDVQSAIDLFLNDHGLEAVRHTEAMLQSRWIRMLFDDSAALDARKTFKWIVFNQRNKHVDEGDGDVSDDEDDYWQDEETEDSQDGEEGGKGEDSSNRYELYDGW
ncbi:hypothetical protein P389DRAFT_213123 [Cystobasidium minutum MCA 4210]|uniref:uncharacterized protein n=1 Tax=Cystobasidium minutum MCA 4210 TaxID=1397322 RepID=UPI0034CD0C1F|eukprot:jgi/Rhomi1/213123/estExt_Genemark1.C_90080